MSVAITIDASGIENLESFFARFPAAAARSMSIAINDTARKGLPLAREEITDQVNFPPGYLNDPDKLRISKFSTPTDLSAVISSKDRPTSLSRFFDGVLPATAGFKTGVKVTVKPGTEKKLPGAWRINLNSGNVGLAIRLRPGETIQGRSGAGVSAVQIFPDVYLLYGPSVAQVFDTVAVDLEKPLGDNLEAEFLRQINLRVNGDLDA